MIRAKQYLVSLLPRFVGKNSTGKFQGLLAKAVAGTFGIRVTNVLLAYVNNLLLAQFLGAEGYGTYAYAIAWVTLLQIPAMLGLTPLLTREIAVYQTQSTWNLASGLWRWASRTVLLASGGLALLAVVVAWQLFPASNPQALLVFCLAMLSLPFMALTRIQQGVMHAFKHIVRGQLPEVLIRPGLLTILLGGVYFALGKNMTTSWAMAIYVVATSIAFFISRAWLGKFLPAKIHNAQPKYQGSQWLHSALPMLLMGSMYIVNNKTDTIMLGIMQDPTAVGIYTVANRGAGMIAFVLVAFNLSLAPTFASLYAAGNRERLQHLLTKSCRLIFLFSLPITLGLIFLGHWFLLIFGSEFVSGRTTLSILCLGQMINASTGSIGVLLNMTGHQKYTAWGVSISAVINIILNAVLIPLWGVNGAAIATATSTIIWNTLLAIFVVKKLKIYPTFLGNISSASNH